MIRIEKDKLRTEALLVRGIDIENPEGKRKKIKRGEEPIFKDPADYEKMSKEDRQRATEEMKKKLSGVTSMMKTFGNIENASGC